MVQFNTVKGKTGDIEVKTTWDLTWERLGRSTISQEGFSDNTAKLNIVAQNPELYFSFESVIKMSANSKTKEEHSKGLNAKLSFSFENEIQSQEAYKSLRRLIADHYVVQAPTKITAPVTKSSVSAQSEFYSTLGNLHIGQKLYNKADKKLLGVVTNLKSGRVEINGIVWVDRAEITEMCVSDTQGRVL